MKESIKKVVLTVLCFVMMLYAAALSTNAASENHCEYFDELLSRKRGLCLDIYNRDDSWGIANFTFFYTIENKEQYITDVEYDGYNSTEHYSIPASVFEKAARKHFIINDINAFRNGLNKSGTDYRFDFSTKTYRMFSVNGGCGYGGVIPVKLYGYKAEGNGKYSIYGYNFDPYRTDNYEPKSGEVEFLDYCVFDDYGGERRIFEIVGLIRYTFVIENYNVKFISYETISKLPKLNSLITYDTDAGDHVYSAATCTKPKTCKICKETRGKALGHKYDNNCDTSCNRCKATRKITHTYKTTTTKATLAKNGSVVKKCTVCGKVASKTTIKYAKTFKLAANTFVYNGKARNPVVTVKDSAGKVLKKGTDYTVTYASGRKNVGTYKVTVKMIGKYSGTKVLTFKINPQGVAISKITAGVKSFTAAWVPKTAQVTGYEIQYSTAKSFSGAKKVTVTSNKTKNKIVESLKAGKKYFVRIRTYKTVGKVKFFSAWSAVKTVTPKAK